jgi:hypothetical protein
MPLENFLSIQAELWWAFGWFARWWLILFAFGGVSLAVFMFFLSVINSWIDSRY